MVSLPTIRRGACALVLSLLPVLAGAQTYPAKPIRFVVGFPAGSITDNLARILAEHVKGKLGQPVVVENKAGANGVVGAAEVARAAPDGYTVLVSNSSTITVNPLLYKKIGYEQKDLLPVTLVTAAPFILTIHADKDLGAPVNSVADLVKVAKAKPGALSYGSAGQGNLMQLTMELFSGQAGVKMLHVPYKSGALATTALLAREVDAVFDTPTIVSQVKAGKVKALAVSTPSRWRDLPDVPTLAEAGYAGFDASFWLGVSVPAPTPMAIARTLHEAIRSAADVPTTRAQLNGLGDVLMLDPERFAARVKRETEDNLATIKRANIVIE